MPLQNITVAITGGIAAYKGCEFVRGLKKLGYNVHVAMTAEATEFVTPLTFEALSGNPVALTEWHQDGQTGMPHIQLNREADLVIVIPATANILGKMAHGIADDLVSTLLLARRSPTVVVPAMNMYMWQNPATQANVETLKKMGVLFWGPQQGLQACGDVGEGRMLEVDDLLDLMGTVGQPPLLQGQSILLTAGPTYEPIDDVRGITNLSSGKQGYALARALRNLGATVTLVSGPVHLKTPTGVERFNVLTAQEMYDTVHQLLDERDFQAFIGVAAVADWHIQGGALSGKRKKHAGEIPVLTLEENPDILASVAQRPHAPLCVGFAAESEDLERYARDKLQKKKLRFVVANLARNTLGANDNEVLIVDQTKTETIARSSKELIAEAIAKGLAHELNSQN